MQTVLELCDRAMLLDSGHLAFDGPAKDAVNLYEASALRSRFQTGERPLQIVVADAGSAVPVREKSGGFYRNGGERARADRRADGSESD